MKLLLALVACIWGSTFPLIQCSLNDIPPFQFVFYRFAIASAAMGAFTLLRKRKMDSSPVLCGVGLGVFLFGGYAFQAVALKFTTPAHSAFLTGLSLVFVPTLGMGLKFEKMSLSNAIGVFIS